MTIAVITSLRQLAPRMGAALFVSLFFFIPAHVAPVYVLTALMLLLSLFEGRFREKWTILRGDSLFWIFEAFFWIIPLSLLWTEDLAAGLKMLGRYGFFLLSPLYLLVARREHAGDEEKGISGNFLRRDFFRHFLLASLMICAFMSSNFVFARRT